MRDLEGYKLPSVKATIILSEGPLAQTLKEEIDPKILGGKVREIQSLVSGLLK